MGEPTEVGWQIASFVVDTLRPVAGAQTTETSIWSAYCAWCAAHNRVALSEPIFLATLGTLAGSVGITYGWNGTHTTLNDVAVAE